MNHGILELLTISGALIVVVKVVEWKLHYDFRKIRQLQEQRFQQRLQEAKIEARRTE